MVFWVLFLCCYRICLKEEGTTNYENSISSDEDWQLATEALKKTVQRMCKFYVVNEGDGAFYGSKLDFHLRDSIGRIWQSSVYGYCGRK